MNEIQNAVQEMYATTPEGTRAAFHGEKDRAVAYYRDYIAFVSHAAPFASSASSKPHLLDIGCGCGWSSYAFVEAGCHATGIDLNASAFEPPPTPNLTLLEASATDLPFADNAFDIVATYQCIEHVPDPERALREMLRVCKPGGTLCIVGPNLLSLMLPFKYAAAFLTGREKLALARTAATPRHPYGNTLPETLAGIPVTIARVGSKVLSRKATFTMRVPDTVPPFHADNDACYLCNPTDFLKWFPKHDCDIIQVGKVGRLPLSYLFTGGVWIAARKR